MQNSQNYHVLILLAALAMPATAHAQDDEASGKHEQSLQIDFERLDLGDDYGTLDKLAIDYKAVMGDTTVVFTSEFGERQNAAGEYAALRVNGTLYQDFNDSFSGRSSVSVSENEPVFARLELAQDFTYKVAPNTAVTAGVRYANYFGDRDVLFYSLGARQYFKGGSLSYRLSVVDPDNHNAFLSHLANLTVNDPHGRGKTQFWLSAGGTAIERLTLEDQYTGTDYSGSVKRLQPLTKDLDLVISAGLTSYDRPTGRTLGNSVGLGLKLDVD
jgi:YaiO family outer membrane protein